MGVTTGVTTDEAFRKAITDRGAELSNQATADSLVDAINSVGGTIDFDSTNEDVVYAINTEIEEFDDSSDLDTPEGEE